MANQVTYISRIGEAAIAKARDSGYVLAVLAGTGLLAVRPAYWPRTVRNVLARQILFTGVEAITFQTVLAIIIGTSVVLQAQLWLTKVGKGELAGSLLVVLIIRELAPLLANLVIIIRSASAVASEMANMKVSGEVRLLDAQGLDPLVYLVMPRVIGMAFCVLGLAVWFVIVSLISGYVVGALLGLFTISPSDYFGAIFRALGPSDVLNLLAKSILPGMMTAAICATEGLGIASALTEVPRATSRGLARSVIAMFFTSAVVSVLTYV